MCHQRYACAASPRAALCQHKIVGDAHAKAKPRMRVHARSGWKRIVWDHKLLGRNEKTLTNESNVRTSSGRARRPEVANG